MYGISRWTLCRATASSRVHDATRAAASLAIERSIDCTPHDFLCGGDGADAVAMHAADDSGRIELHPKQRPDFAGPQELVRFITVQEVVLGGSFFDGFPDRQPDCHQADALSGKRFVKP